MPLIKVSPKDESTTKLIAANDLETLKQKG